jgi:hypothetical protein
MGRRKPLQYSGAWDEGMQKTVFWIVFYKLYIFYGAQETSAVLWGLGQRDAVKTVFWIVFYKLYIFYGAQETSGVLGDLG